MLSEKFDRYLSNYTDHTVGGFQKGVDFILGKAAVNESLEEFTINFFLDAFGKRGPESMVYYITEKYGAGCTANLSEEIIEKMEHFSKAKEGRPAPDLVLNDPNGEQTALSSVITGNKLVALFFWASSCPHCHDAMPFVKNLYDQYKEKGLEIYAVSVDTNKAEWLSAIDEYDMNWKNVCDFKGWKSEGTLSYNIRMTPMAVLVNNEGIILKRNLQGTNLKKEIEAYLGS